MMTLKGFMKIVMVLLMIELLWVTELASTPAPPDNDPDTIRIAWMVYNDLGDRGKDFKAFKKYLRRKTGKKIELEIIENYAYDKIIHRMKKQPGEGKRIDLAFFTPYTYVKASRIDPNIKAFLTYELSGKNGEGAIDKYAAYFVWKSSDAKSGEINKILQLLVSRQKRLIYVNHHSTSGFLWPKSWLEREHKIYIVRDQIRLIKSEGHLTSLKMLLNDHDIAAAAVWEVDYDKFESTGQISQKLEKITIGPLIPNDPIAIRSGFSIEEEDRIRKVFLNMHKDSRGKKVLKKETFKRFKRWVVAEDKDYYIVRNYTSTPPPKKLLGIKLKDQTPDRKIIEFDKQVKQSLRQSFFQLSPNPSESDDIFFTYRMKKEEDFYTIEGEINGNPIEPLKSKKVENLVEETSNFLKQAFPLKIFVSEAESDWSGKLVVELTKKEGIKKYHPVEITKRFMDQNPSINGKPINAYVSEANYDYSYLKPLNIFSEKEISNNLLDPDDDIYYVVKVVEPEILPDGIELTACDVKISKDGYFIADYNAGIYRNNNRVKAGSRGLGLIVKPLESAKIFSCEDSKEPVSKACRFFIKPGEHSTKFSILLSNALTSKISITPIHPNTEEKIAGIWFTVVWIFFTWAFIGGFIGGLIRFAGTLKKAPPELKKRIAKALFDICFGVITGGVLLLIVLLIPDLFGFLKSVSKQADGPAGRLVIGIIGGIIGASGLSGAVQKKVLK